MVSTDPARGAGTWREVDAGLGLVLGTVACPSVSLCVAGGFDGDLLTTTDPSGGGRAWRVSHVDGSASVVSVSCPAVTLCAAIDDAGNVLSSTNPTGGASAWRTDHLVGNDVGHGAVSCASISLCVAVVGDTVLRSTRPAAGRCAWRVRTVDALGLVDSISCPRISFCAAGDIFGGAATTTRPTGPPRAWQLKRVDGTNAINAVSCPSVNLCVAVDGTGNVVVGSATVATVRVPTIVRPAADNEQLTAIRRGSRLRIDAGLAITCPRRGRACTLNARARGGTDSGRARLLASLHVPIPPGRQREIAFTLSKQGARYLNKRHGFIADGSVTVVARVDGGNAVADELLCSLAKDGDAPRAHR